jgi:ubiquinone/menaquinone biosynthesis C-methylase UbiE
MKGHRLQDTQRQYYADTAEMYDSWHVGTNETTYDVLRVVVALVDVYQISSVLDVGCGTGRGADFLLRRGLNAYGVEPVREMLDQAEGKNAELSNRLVCGSGSCLPFKNESFDAVCEFGVLHHVQQPNRVVTNMLRVARRAIFLSDSNRFGQGRPISRVMKLLLYKLHLWGLADRVKTKGRRYNWSVGDGLSYSYSVYDSYSLIAQWADRIVLIGTGEKKRLKSWHHPLLTSEGVLLCAFKE